MNLKVWKENAAKILGEKNADNLLCRKIDEDLMYVLLKNGKQMIIDKNLSCLFASSTVRFDELLREFSEGRRSLSKSEIKKYQKIKNDEYGFSFLIRSSFKLQKDSDEKTIYSLSDKSKGDKLLIKYGEDDKTIPAAKNTDMNFFYINKEYLIYRLYEEKKKSLSNYYMIFHNLNSFPITIKYTTKKGDQKLLLDLLNTIEIFDTERSKKNKKELEKSPRVAYFADDIVGNLDKNMYERENSNLKERAAALLGEKNINSLTCAKVDEDSMYVLRDNGKQMIIDKDSSCLYASETVKFDELLREFCHGRRSLSKAEMRNCKKIECKELGFSFLVPNRLREEHSKIASTLYTFSDKKKGDKISIKNKLDELKEFIEVDSSPSNMRFMKVNDGSLIYRPEEKKLKKQNVFFLFFYSLNGQPITIKYSTKGTSKKLLLDVLNSIELIHNNPVMEKPKKEKIKDEELVTINIHDIIEDIDRQIRTLDEVAMKKRAVEILDYKNIDELGVRKLDDDKMYIYEKEKDGRHLIIDKDLSFLCGTSMITFKQLNEEYNNGRRSISRDTARYKKITNEKYAFSFLIPESFKEIDVQNDKIIYQFVSKSTDSGLIIKRGLDDKQELVMSRAKNGQLNPSRTKVLNNRGKIFIYKMDSEKIKGYNVYYLFFDKLNNTPMTFKYVTKKDNKKLLFDILNSLELVYKTQNKKPTNEVGDMVTQITEKITEAKEVIKELETMIDNLEKEKKELETK